MPQLETKTKYIGSMEVRTIQFGVMRQAKLLTKLGKSFAPLLRNLGGIDGSDNADAILPALAALFDSLSEPQIVDLQLSILAGTTVTVDGKMQQLDSESAIDLAFGSDLEALFATLKFALEVNFSGPFQKYRVVLQTLIQAGKKEES